MDSLLWSKNGVSDKVEKTLVVPSGGDGIYLSFQASDDQEWEAQLCVNQQLTLDLMSQGAVKYVKEEKCVAEHVQWNSAVKTGSADWWPKIEVCEAACTVNKDCAHFVADYSCGGGQCSLRVCRYIKKQVTGKSQDVFDYYTQKNCTEL